MKVFLISCKLWNMVGISVERLFLSVVVCCHPSGNAVAQPFDYFERLKKGTSIVLITFLIESKTKYWFSGDGKIVNEKVTF